MAKLSIAQAVPVLTVRTTMSASPLANAARRGTDPHSFNSPPARS
jgi:hypothetical protein